ncbi:F0F1 ATP synthase subunit gamma [Methylocystis echinoides]|uniref:ATP synthase subunit gamma n=1 Tax=Methylocystis echinoides TaxID=29468 RepID=A0A9W6GXY6_9HYPH|nr:F0F1 ATP synthase subunit gamma [Methylocystis echinoides]GLI95156.1 ATP synthase subunit gamma [Methylocystis echinoides]
MTRLAEIQAHLDSIGELRNIIGAMRSLAGMRLQETQHSLPAVRRYAEAVAAALASTLPLMREPMTERALESAPRAVILCFSEHGFVGGFNERLADAAERALSPQDLLFVLGTRGATLLAGRGRRIAWSRPMATRVAGAPETVRRVTSELYMRIARGEISRVEAMFARRLEGGAPTIEQRLLLPLDLTLLAAKQPRYPPLHNLNPIRLHEMLMAEHVFALLSEAAVESMASENAARFAAMGSAHDNVSKKLDQLRQAEREARQNEITTELLDLITGASAQGQGQGEEIDRR